MTNPSTIPSVLPIFPLTGVLLLPGSRLPLHVFETRYRHMTEDALENDGFIGVIQPYAATPPVIDLDDPSQDLAAATEEPAVYEIGCAGEIEQWERLPDGRYYILLVGVARFRVEKELPLQRGYRRVEASYQEFSVDAEDRAAEISPRPLLDALRAFGDQHGIGIELDRLGELSGLALLNSIAMGLPFPPAEKQALLEAADIASRQEMLLTLLEMGLQRSTDGVEPVLH